MEEIIIEDNPSPRNKGLKIELVNYLKESSILLGGLVLLELLLVFPAELQGAGFNLETMVYTGQLSIVRAFGLAFIRALGISTIRSMKKIVGK